MSNFLPFDHVRPCTVGKIFHLWAWRDYLLIKTDDGQKIMKWSNSNFIQNLQSKFSKLVLVKLAFEI